MSIAGISKEVLISAAKITMEQTWSNMQTKGWVRQKAMGVVQRQLPWALAGSAVGSIVGGGQAWIQGRDPIRGAAGGAVRGAGWGFAAGMGYEGFLGARGAYRSLQAIRPGATAGQVATIMRGGWLGGQRRYMDRFRSGVPGVSGTPSAQGLRGLPTSTGRRVNPWTVTTGPLNGPPSPRRNPLSGMTMNQYKENQNRAGWGLWPKPIWK